MNAVSTQACRVLRLFGINVPQVSATVGAEQEYFLIDKEEYKKRRDLILTGRTLFGCPPAKGQEMEEHYFGVIRPVVSAYMKEVDEELWKLGILAKTKHNEVAPAQHELAPVFTTANAAVDGNLLTMEVMRRVAEKHGLICLLHEKPFAGVNGSGKHDNWSLSAPGLNLLDPGTKPMENLRFLVFLAAVIKAVDEYQDLLRVAVASAGNDHRLGANEAPPAIISMFVGDELGEVIEALASDAEYHDHESQNLDFGVDILPKFSKDNTDRNRTSPFAFTGNKFEFRAPGSSMNLADVNTFLNTAVAKELRDFADVLESAENFEAEAMALVKKTIKAHKRIIFNGDGYSEEWQQEAARRGLYNLKSTVDALPHMLSAKNISLMNDFGVLSPAEIRARFEVSLETYSKTLNIEALTMLEMANQQIVPAIINYEEKLARTIAVKQQVSKAISCAAETHQLETLAECADIISAAIDELRTARKAAKNDPDPLGSAQAFHDRVIPIMDRLRAAADHAEQVCGEDYWPLPTYTQMLWYVKDMKD